MAESCLHPIGRRKRSLLAAAGGLVMQVIFLSAPIITAWTSLPATNSHWKQKNQRITACHSDPSSTTIHHGDEHNKSFHPTLELYEDENIVFGWTDDEFKSWFLAELKQHDLSTNYPELFERAAQCVTNWRRRYRGDIVLWRRLFKKDRVAKEFVEAAPILQALLEWMQQQQQQHSTASPPAKITIFDLASGKGYLSMMMSELLPPEMVAKCVLIDKQWPMCKSTPQPRHIRWDHIYGTNPTTGECYFDTWPIPLHTSKQNLKRSSNKRQIQRLFIDPAPGPVAVVAVHLCGTLSLSAIEMMNCHEKVEFLALKPCCLPDMSYSKQELVIGPGSYYSFPGAEVCAAGYWKCKQWHGPPRWHLEARFEKWCHHLLLGIAADDKSRMEGRVQLDGGFQNTFLFAQSNRKSASMAGSTTE